MDPCIGIERTPALLPPVQGVSHHWLKAGDACLHYASAGDERGGPLVVLLHGFPELWYAWRHQLVALAGSHHVVAPDLRGYGLSSRPAGRDAYRISRLVDDVRRLADHLGARRIVLVGHDWGGVVAWAFATRHPDRVAKLVIINAPHPAILARQLRRSPRQMLASSYILLFRAPFRLAERVLRAGDHAILEQLLTRGRRRGYFTSDDEAVYRVAWRAPGALTASLQYYRSASLRGTQGVARVRSPTIVVWGERDRYLRPGMLDGLDAYVSDLEIVRVPDASHWIVHERPALITRVIADAAAAAPE